MAADINAFFTVLAFSSGVWTILSTFWMLGDTTDGRKPTATFWSAALGFWMTALCASIAAAAS